MENGFGLTTITTLFSVVSSFTLLLTLQGDRDNYLSEYGGFAGFVLSDLVDGVFSAVLAFAISSSSLWDVDCTLASYPIQL